MTTLITDEELEKFESNRDIGAEILQGIKDMLNNNAARRTTVIETDISPGSKNRSNE
ncbi:hypothetical protein Q5M50_00440 [Acinetobacter baumannii]|uniref:hypothetical protein n=1 Tax=Acinetobacter baumannii TaxID=470 RepID=UPI002448C4DE|nr:hypothetical protein [Acinetobacter baumannii]MDH2549392.1 hypothetical protein [Acinetobacter baumannii]MDO7519907.1 hypothetical protein [Acinetobacter baumannii]